MINDSLGRTIQDGDTIIYNLSGELAKGTVISQAIRIQQSTWRDYTTYTIKVKHIAGGNRPNNGISTVTNPKSIIVIDASVV